MQNTEVKGLLSKLRSAAEAIKAQIHEADNQIAALNEQRRALINAPVSKDDFMGYVRADIQRRAEGYQHRLRKWARKYDFPLKFAQLERDHIAGGLQPFPYLDGETPFNNAELDPGAVFWHFGELIAENFSVALDGLEWPEDELPVADRRRQILEIDAEIERLNAQRDGLAKDLMDSGMYE